LKLLGGGIHPSGPGVYLAGTWLGQKASLPSQLAPFLSAIGDAPSHNGSATLSYLAAMMSYAGCANIPLAECQTGAGGKLQRVASAATSHVPYQPLDDAGIATIIAQVTAASAVPGMTEGGISMDALGGAVGALAPDATAFPHRKALMTVQYTATFADRADPAPFDTYVRGFRAALVPKWGNGAYLNYADASLQNSATAYFGDNATRLASIRKKYDPRGMFTQPQGY
jgi:hypothetical protein